MDSCSVYVLLKNMPDGIYVKIGISADPIRRLRELIHGLPWVPDTLSYYRMRTRVAARDMEGYLLLAHRNCRTRGEWHLLPADQLVAFKRTLQVTGSRYVKKSHGGKWATMSVPEFLEAAEQARIEKSRRVLQERKSRPKRKLRGLQALSYRDFKDHAAEAFSPYRRVGARH